MDYKNNNVRKEINVVEVVKYLNYHFAKAITKLGSQVGFQATRVKKNGRWVSTNMYDHQVDFAYMVDNIIRGPRYVAKANIQMANDLIDELERSNHRSR